MKSLKIITGTAITAAILATSAGAQDAAPESILPQPEAQETAPSAQPRTGRTVDEAFGDIRLQCGEVVQEIPSLEGVWTIAQAEDLLAFIPGMKAEGLNPSDYRASELKAAIAAGEGEELNRLASEIFVWMVEDLRDGRTPMASAAVT